MAKGYHYSNENGKEVYGRAADNHWMSVNGYNRVSDVIDAAAQEGAKQAANKIKGKLLTNEMAEENRKNIKSS